MGKSKRKRKLLNKGITDEPEETSGATLIKNLPAQLLTMRVKSGTKIRNVLNYSIKEFEKYGSVLWIGAGQAVGKVISCVEMFKRAHKDLFQVTQLHYIDSKNNFKDDEKHRQIPEIHIYLTKTALKFSEPGYQRPDDINMFQNSFKDAPQELQGQGNKNKMSSIAAEEFAKMGLRTGQKRPRGNFMGETSTKKSRTIASD